MEFSPLTVVVGNDASGKTGIQVSGEIIYNTGNQKLMEWFLTSRQ